MPPGEGREGRQGQGCEAHEGGGPRSQGEKGLQAEDDRQRPERQEVAEALQNRGRRAERENGLWASDLTYLPTDSGFCYLVVVMDLFNREVEGWDVSGSMEAENTMAAFMDAVKKALGNLEEPVFHPDRGIQYCSAKSRGRLGLLKVDRSMSWKGNRYDNAFAESFFHTPKNELEKAGFEDLDEARAMVSGYINWYNRERMHSSLGYLSPMDYVSRGIGNVA